MITSISAAAEFGRLAEQYQRMRERHPLKSAAVIVAYLKSEHGVSFEEFCCPGHEWEYTGTAYGGDDDRWSGEGRCYCIHCGADGDA